LSHSVAAAAAFLRHFLAQDRVIASYGTQIYAILFLIVFAETGLVVTPFLPGDSLLFAAGAFAGSGVLSLPAAVGVLIIAALAGDNTNYLVGRYLGPRLLRNENSRLLNRKHLDRTHAFFEKYGGKTIVMARFVPIVRTFTPFVAGVGAMAYARFLAFSVAAALLWVGVCVSAGYLFGGLEPVKKHFELAILAVIAISLIPAAVEIVRHRRAATVRV